MLKSNLILKLGFILKSNLILKLGFILKSNLILKLAFILKISLILKLSFILKFVYIQNFEFILNILEHPKPCTSSLKQPGRLAACYLDITPVSVIHSYSLNDKMTSQIQNKCVSVHFNNLKTFHCGQVLLQKTNKQTKRYTASGFMTFKLYYYS